MIVSSPVMVTSPITVAILAATSLARAFSASVKLPVSIVTVLLTITLGSSVPVAINDSTYCNEAELLIKIAWLIVAFAFNNSLTSS